MFFGFINKMEKKDDLLFINIFEKLSRILLFFSFFHYFII
jgi:hypothetical protein